MSPTSFEVWDLRGAGMSIRTRLTASISRHFLCVMLPAHSEEPSCWALQRSNCKWPRSAGEGTSKSWFFHASEQGGCSRRENIAVHLQITTANHLPPQGASLLSLIALHRYKCSKLGTNEPQFSLGCFLFLTSLIWIVKEVTQN